MPEGRVIRQAFSARWRRANASIQEITDAADVGFGSFYNHCESKEELFDAAVRATLEAYDVLRNGLVAEYADPQKCSR